MLLLLVILPVGFLDVAVPMRGDLIGGLLLLLTGGGGLKLALADDLFALGLTNGLGSGGLLVRDGEAAGVATAAMRQYMPVCTDLKMAGLPGGSGSVRVVLLGLYAEYCSGDVLPLPGAAAARLEALVVRTVSPSAAVMMLMGWARGRGGPGAAGATGSKSCSADALLGIQ